MSDKAEDISTYSFVQDDGSVKRVTIGELMESFGAYQRAHYAGIIAKRKREIEINHPLWTDEQRQAWLQETIDMPNADHARSMEELSKLAARGMRLDNETLQ